MRAILADHAQDSVGIPFGLIGATTASASADSTAEFVLACGRRADAVYDAIASTLPKGAARRPMKRDRGHELAVVDRIRIMRRPS